jgi:YggT family protein
MDFVLYLIRSVVRIAVIALQLCMMGRAVMSWFQFDEESPLYSFAVAVTEPVITPIRILLERFEFVASSPIDISFLVAFLLLSVLQMLL